MMDDKSYAETIRGFEARVASVEAEWKRYRPLTGQQVRHTLRSNRFLDAVLDELTVRADPRTSTTFDLTRWDLRAAIEKALGVPGCETIEDDTEDRAERYEEALRGLLRWIGGWRDEIDGELEEIWRVRFRVTTPELVQAQRALDEEERA